VKKKVFVSGCYDMLHSGHVAFFEEAAGYGDLYVGIGSDKTINALKARKTVNTVRPYASVCLVFVNIL
jgi:cytidyltransferase-like protein